MLDARDPIGTRSRHLEQHLKKEARQKHMILLLNKCDLVSIGHLEVLRVRHTLLAFSMEAFEKKPPTLLIPTTRSY